MKAQLCHHAVITLIIFWGSAIAVYDAFAVIITGIPVASGSSFPGVGGTAGGVPSASDRVGGGNLTDIFNAAADWWELHLPGDEEIDIHYGWFNHTDGALADGAVISTNGIRPTAGTIRFDRNGNSAGNDYVWFMDNTPSVREEYYRSENHVGNAGGGSVNVGRRFKAPFISSGAFGNYDLFSTAVHEIGHALGMGTTSRFTTETSDGDIDIVAPLPLPGSAFLVDGSSGHLSTDAYPNALMCNACGEQSVRRMISTADILSIAQLSGFAVDLSPDFHWQGIGIAGTGFDGSFTDVAPFTSHWHVGVVPGPASDVFFDLAPTGAAAYTVSFESNIEMGNLRVANGDSVILDIAETIAIANSLTVTSSSMASILGDVVNTGPLDDPGEGSFNFQTITLSGGGTLSARSFEKLSGGIFNHNNGTLIIDGGVFNPNQSDYHLQGVGTSSHAILTLRNGATWDEPNVLTVARGQDGTLNIESGSDVTVGSNLIVGRNDLDSDGTVNVTGIGSTLTVGNTATIGGFENGYLYVGGGGRMDIGNDLRVNSQPGSTGLVTVGSTINVADTVTIGATGEVRISGGVLTAHTLDNTHGGTFILDDGGLTIDGGTLDVGYENFRIGGAFTNMSGGISLRNGATWNLDGTLEVGGGAGGALNVSSGGNVTSGGGRIGITLGFNNFAMIADAGSSWTVDDNTLYVGSGGRGSLSVANGGTVSVTNGQAILGDSNISIGELTIDGSGSSFNVGGDDLLVGNRGNGTLLITVGGLATSRSGQIAVETGSVGQVEINGFGSRWEISQQLSVGGDTSTAGGTGSLLVRNGGALEVYGAIRNWSGDTITLDSDGSISAFTFDNTHGGTFNHFGGTLTINGGSFLSGVPDLDLSAPGNPTMRLTSGADAAVALAFVGHDANDRGTLVVDGTGSTFSSTGSVFVGRFDGALGHVTFSNGSVTSIGNDLLLGYTGGEGHAVVETGARVNVVDSVFVGRIPPTVGPTPTSTLTIRSGGVLAAENHVMIPGSTSGKGHVELTGADSRLDIGQTSGVGDLYVGRAGGGTMEIAAGAEATVADRLYVGFSHIGALSIDGGTVGVGHSVEVGRNASGDGTVIMTGGVLTTGMDPAATDPDLEIGVSGFGAFIQSGGTVQVADEIVLGYETAGEGTLLIQGGTMNAEAAYVGRLGTGQLTVGGTGELVTTGDFVIGRDVGSAGTTTVEPGGRLIVGNILDMGINGTGTLDVLGGEVQVAQSIFVRDGGTVNLAGGEIFARLIQHDLGGSFNFTGGELSLESFLGDLVQDGGTFSPDDMTRITSLAGDYLQNDGSLRIDISSLGFEQLQVSGQTTLTDTLAVSLLDGFVPALGSQYQILNSTAGILGEFSALDLPVLPTGLSWDLDYSSHAAFLSVVASSTAGDFDSDGDVDGRDFLKWQRGNSPSPLSVGDLADWRTNYGAGGLSAVTAVPEPTPFALFLMTIFAGCAKRRIAHRVPRTRWRVRQANN